MEEKPMYGGLTVYRERGAYLHRLEQFEKAKSSYDEGFKFAQDDLRLLIGRSQVCADAVRPQQAFADAEAALKLEPSNMNALNVQARAMYTMSDFEQSTVTNYRGARIRQQPPYFKEGIIQGLETIQDCVGTNAGQVLSDFLPIIKQQPTIIGQDLEPTVVKHVSRIPKFEVKKKLSQLEARKHKLLSRVLAMKYLGPMAYDKFFLQELVNDKCVHSANSAGSRKLKQLAQDALQSLVERQEMLRSQRPYYTIKRGEKSESKYLNNLRKAELENERMVGLRHAEYSLRQIDKCLRERRIMDLMRRAERMQIFLDSKTPHNLPEKEVYIDRLYRYVGEGYLSMYRVSYQLSEKSNRSRIAFLMGIYSGRPTSFDSVRANFPFKYTEGKILFDKLMADLEMCENSYMKCWILYELAQVSNHQKNYALAKFYAKRCQREAQEIGSTTWWLNACFCLMSGDLRQGNTHDVENMIEEAFEWTGKLQFPDQVRTFLRKCLNMATDVLVSDESKEIVKRERQILKIMDEKSRTDAKVLFKRMSTVPAGRRFSVLPKQAPAGLTAAAQQQGSERRKFRQRGLSVIPGAQKYLPPPPLSSVPGYQVFDL